MARYRKKDIEFDTTMLERRTELFNEIVRVWFHKLSALERLAVIFVFDRTLGWNKEWEIITFNQFTEGIFSFDEDEQQFDIYAAPFTKDRTRAQKIIKGLIEKGALKRREVPFNSKGL